jgi:hypothetical protein
VTVRNNTVLLEMALHMRENLGNDPGIARADNSSSAAPLLVSHMPLYFVGNHRNTFINVILVVPGRDGKVIIRWK